VLEANGIPVPHVYGLCPDPLAIVMDKAPGHSDLSTAGEDERCAVLDHYAEILAAIHKIDVAQFEAIGMKRPVGPAAIAHNLFDEFVSKYRTVKRRPEPILEFLIGWAYRNAPRHRNRVSFVCGDPGQFMYENGRVTVVNDFEIAFLGDPIHDLAGLPLRDTGEPLGDIGRLVSRYVELSGETIEESVFDFHMIQWAIVTPLGTALDNISQPLPMGALVIYMEWFVHYARIALELIAYRTGVTLGPLTMPEFKPPKFGIMADALVGAVRAIPVIDTFASYQRESAAQMAVYLNRIGAMGPALEQQDVAETQALLGAQFDGWWAADAALEEFVRTATADQAKGLIPLLYRRIQRQMVLLEPVLSRPESAASVKCFASLMMQR
jgi:hypothetical protein